LPTNSNRRRSTYKEVGSRQSHIYMTGGETGKWMDVSISVQNCDGSTARDIAHASLFVSDAAAAADLRDADAKFSLHFDWTPCNDDNNVSVQFVCFSSQYMISVDTLQPSVCRTCPSPGKYSYISSCRPCNVAGPAHSDGQMRCHTMFFTA